MNSMIILTALACMCTCRCVDYIVQNHKEAPLVKDLLRHAKIDVYKSTHAAALLSFMKNDREHIRKPLYLRLQLGNGKHCVWVEYPVVGSKKINASPIVPVLMFFLFLLTMYFYVYLC